MLTSDTSDTFLYVTLLVTDRPRAIDQVINYFGDPPRTRELPPPRLHDLQHAG